MTVTLNRFCIIVVNNFMKTLLILLLSLIANSSICQSESIKLTKGKWTFCVVDTILSPYNCGESKETTFKFRANGKYVEKGISMVSNGKKIKKLRGEWTLTGTTLEIDAYDLENIRILLKTIEIEILNSELFFSAQKDYKTVYWLFSRI